MKVKIPNPSPIDSGKQITLRSFRSIKLLSLILITSLFLAAISQVVIHQLAPLGVKEKILNVVNGYGFSAFKHDYRLRHSLTRMPTYLARYVRGNQLPTIAIDIKFVDVQKLEAKRREALRANQLVTGADDFVPATIRTSGETLRAELRLKGDNVDHLESNKWSMRIHLKGDDHFLGLRRFSIQHPKTRGFHAEALFHETLQEFDIITPRYFFINVVVNGDDQGIMAIEEHFTKELLEHSGRKESVVVKFDESLYWSGWTLKTDTPFLVNPFQLYQNASLDAFQTGKISQSPTLSRDYEVALGLLRGFTSGLLTASEVFDAQLLGKYLGSSEFWGAWHEVRWRNLRFYYNPFTMRLEPIPFDGNLHHRMMRLDRSIVWEPIVKKMLADPKVQEVYESTLRYLADRVLEGTMVEDLKEFERPILEQLQTEFFMLESYDFDELYERAKLKATQLNARRVGANGWIQPEGDFGKIPVFAHAYLVDGASDKYLELLNVLPMAVEIRSIFWRDADGDTEAFQPLNSIDYPFKLPETNVNGHPSPIKIPYEPPSDSRFTALAVEFGLEGFNDPHEIREYTAKQMVAPLRANPMPNADIEEQLAQHPFLTLSDDGSTVQAAVGTWLVQETIIIPSGYSLEISGGTTLQFQDSACLIVYGTTIFNGADDAKIILEGLPSGDSGTGYWKGLIVHSAPDRSVWSHVEVRNTTGVNLPNWSLTGGTTFYRSDVDMADSVFSGMVGEDALNIIHSNFALVDIQIMNTASDGFDADFTTGTISGGFFHNIGTRGGGDAIDFSGSEILVDGATFTQVYDKAISVGEGSTLTIRNVSIEDVSVALASKDGSRVEIRDSTVSNAGYAALMAYSKKSEFGPADLIADNIRIIDTEVPGKAQLGSLLTLNGNQILGQNIDVDGLYQSVMLPGIPKR